MELVREKLERKVYTRKHITQEEKVFTACSYIS